MMNTYPWMDFCVVNIHGRTCVVSGTFGDSSLNPGGLE